MGDVAKMPRECLRFPESLGISIIIGKLIEQEPLDKHVH